MTTPPPRIAPLRPEERDEATRELLDGFGPAGEYNIFTTLVRHPRLLRRWAGFGGVLLTGELPPRDRELMILRTAHRCGADYEWAHHLDIARSAGIDDEEIQRIGAGPQDPGWSDEDAALLRAVDELHEQQHIGDDTWKALAARYDDRQMIEICMVVGQYHLVAFVLRSLGIEVEDGQEPA